MLIDAEIMAKDRNTAAILNLRKPDFRTLDPLGLPIFHLGRPTKFCAKMFIDAEIMAHDGGRPPSSIFKDLISDQ